VVDRSNFEVGFGNTERIFYLPQLYIIRRYLPGGKTGVRNVAFQPIPLAVQLNLFFIHIYFCFPGHGQKTVITPVIDVLFRQPAGFHL